MNSASLALVFVISRCQTKFPKGNLILAVSSFPSIQIFFFFKFFQDFLWGDFMALCQGAGSFCQLDMSSSWHFSKSKFFYLMFCQCFILSTWHIISSTFHQLDISSTWHFINLTFHQLDISLTLHFINLTFCQNTKILSTR